jgi:hypothetical protein
MSETGAAHADESTWAVHFPGNLRWSNAMQIVKGMAPYAAVAMDEVDRVARRLKARAALASEASGQRGNSIVRAPDTRPEPGSSARAALASEASGQRGNSIVRAHSASEDARERADDTRPEPGSSSRAASDRGSPRHPGFHGTSSVDYAIVLAGEIYALMDEGEVLLRQGDVLVQRGTNHAWSNRSDAPAYLAFVLIDADPL